MSSRSIFAITTTVLLAVVFLYFLKPDSKSVDYQSEAHLIAGQCGFDRVKLTCYTQAFAKITAKKSFGFSVRVLKALQSLDSEARQCHGIAHTISSTTVHSQPSSWMDLISQVGMSDCAGGFLHGILEGHVAYDPTFTVKDRKSVV